MIEGTPYTAFAFILADCKKMFALKYPPFILFETPLMPVTVIFIMVVLLHNDAVIVAIIAVVLAYW